MITQDKYAALCDKEVMPNGGCGLTDVEDAAAGEYQQAVGIIELIAKSKLGIDTLKMRNSDGLDFHEVSASMLENALMAAFMAGCETGLNIKQGD